MKLHTYLKKPRTLSGPWTVLALCAAYAWPTRQPGGTTIGIIEMGGGWSPDDLAAFCSQNGVALPTVTDVSVDGTVNAYSPAGWTHSDADVEVALDIEVVAASYFAATGSAAQIRVYWTGDIAAAIAKAASDGCDVLSISWGADEASWGQEAVLACEAAASAGVAGGMTICAAAGDNDASDGGDTPANVDCPASCPSIVGCGGTSKSPSAEVVWDNDPDPSDPDGEGTGGGYSTVFPVQSFQIGAPPPLASSGVAPGRMVPDVAANADPNTGYVIVCYGQQMTIGGTSAVAPLYAGLFGAFGKKIGPVLPKLWENQSDFVDITVGGNGLFQALKGPDPCTGIGVPIGQKLAALFSSAAAPSPAPPAPTPPPAPAPAPPAPAPPSSPTCAEVVAEIGKLLSPHFILFRSQILNLSVQGAGQLLGDATVPTFATVQRALESETFPPFAFRQAALDLVAEAIDPCWDVSS